MNAETQPQAADTPKCIRESDGEHIQNIEQLLADMRRHIRAKTALFETLPASRHTGHCRGSGRHQIHVFTPQPEGFRLKKSSFLALNRRSDGWR